ncbi:DUF4255 domain-containing protein [Streptomyces sp. CA-132043]|uniref:DUF4255 domain-containing protein n=1 Tax=Streptomyces sp. CA-132043 TaxID=3240048 RepID=UPI003D8DD868
MSNALAIATVTQALALLIEHNLHPEIDMAVSVETRKPPAEPELDPKITVFLYQVTHNPSMRNNDLATRAADGTLLKRPAAALDLHYLISAYGEENELVGQRLIGSVVRTLHEIPVLPKELITEAAERPYLGGSDLAESLQRVRFTPTQMDVDETSKLWGMLHNTPYSLSVVYQASLVILDGHEKPVPAKPVKRPDVRVLPFGAPGAPERPSADVPERPSAGAAEAEPERAEEAGKRAEEAPPKGADETGERAEEARKRTGAKPTTDVAATTNVRSTVAKAASGGGARTEKKAGPKPRNTGSRPRTRKAAGGTSGSGSASRSKDTGRADHTGRTDDAGRTDDSGRTDNTGRTDDGKES